MTYSINGLADSRFHNLSSNQTLHQSVAKHLEICRQIRQDVLFKVRTYSINGLADYIFLNLSSHQTLVSFHQSLSKHFQNYKQIRQEHSLILQHTPNGFADYRFRNKHHTRIDQVSHKV